MAKRNACANVEGDAKPVAKATALMLSSPARRRLALSILTCEQYSLIEHPRLTLKPRVSWRSERLQRRASSSTVGMERKSRRRSSIVRNRQVASPPTARSSGNEPGNGIATQTWAMGFLGKPHKQGPDMRVGKVQARFQPAVRPKDLVIEPLLDCPTPKVTRERGLPLTVCTDVQQVVWREKV